MQIGAVGGAGAIGAMDFQPYVYNTNQINRTSMNKVQAIPDDVTTAKTDYSGLTEAEENSNPLRMGESSNFMDIIQSQMQMSRNNAGRIMKPAETDGADPGMDMAEGAGVVEDGLADDGMDAVMEDFVLSKDTGEDSRDQIRMSAEANNVSDATSGLETTSMVQGIPEAAAEEEEKNQSQIRDASRLDEMFSRFQMRRATEAYAFSMGI